MSRYRNQARQDLEDALNAFFDALEAELARATPSETPPESTNS